jgi:murein DD-endopeptidase MepM/ murein hydrolase activator NlpD
MNDRPAETDARDEDHTVRLLRIAGARASVPDARTSRVREAVHARWQVANRRRVMRMRLRWGVGIVVAAAVVLMVGSRSVVDRGSSRSDQLIVAVVERVDGSPHLVTSAASGDARALASRDEVRTGQWVQTGASARVALQFADGASVRIDRDSRVQVLSAGAIELASGAVYIDTGRTAGRFEVRTAVAIARDIGTQFEVRLVPNLTTSSFAIRVRVRTGTVELEQGGRIASGRAGTEVIFSGTGTISRPISAYGPEWDWTASLAPPFDIEGQMLSAFLGRVAHEHGWELRYADASLQREASEIVLHGSVTGLSPGHAVQVAITTSGLRYRLDNGDLVVMRGSDAK